MLGSLLVIMKHNKRYNKSSNIFYVIDNVIYDNKKFTSISRCELDTKKIFTFLRRQHNWF